MEQFITILDNGNNKVYIRKLNTRISDDAGILKSIVSTEEQIDALLSDLKVDRQSCAYMTGFSLNVDINFDL